MRKRIYLNEASPMMEGDIQSGRVQSKFGEKNKLFKELGAGVFASHLPVVSEPTGLAVFEDKPDAEMNPWCLCRSVRGHDVLFGFAQRHPVTGGLAWIRSTPVEFLNPHIGRARTWSGREYKLGRRIYVTDIFYEGIEARIAYEHLVRADADPEFDAATISNVNEIDLRWLSCCKIARHLGVDPPYRTAISVEVFYCNYYVAYMTLRRQWP